MFVTDALISIIINFIAVALFLFSFFKSPRTKLDEVEEEPPEDKELGKF
jgi:large-conductance mechanosensitive channel